MNTDDIAKTSLATAIEANGGLTKVAQTLQVSSNRLANWMRRGVPAEHCPDVEAAVGIPCEILRPDISWHVVRGEQRTMKRGGERA